VSTKIHLAYYKIALLNLIRPHLGTYTLERPKCGRVKLNVNNNLQTIWFHINCPL